MASWTAVTATRSTMGIGIAAAAAAPATWLWIRASALRCRLMVDSSRARPRVEQPACQPAAPPRDSPLALLQRAGGTAQPRRGGPLSDTLPDDERPHPARPRVRGCGLDSPAARAARLGAEPARQAPADSLRYGDGARSGTVGARPALRGRRPAAPLGRGDGDRREVPDRNRERRAGVRAQHRDRARRPGRAVLPDLAALRDRRAGPAVADAARL